MPQCSHLGNGKEGTRQEQKLSPRQSPMFVSTSIMAGKTDSELRENALCAPNSLGLRSALLQQILRVVMDCFTSDSHLGDVGVALESLYLQGVQDG